MKRLLVALALSLLLHAFLFGMHFGNKNPAAFESSVFQVTLRPTMPDVASQGAAVSRFSQSGEIRQSERQNEKVELGDGVLPDLTGLSSYLPGRLLDRRPYSLSEIVVPYPVAENYLVGDVVLVLFIGADGRVDWIEVADSSLPAAFQDAAVMAFKVARMSPGVLRGLPVKSRMKVVVSFGELQ